MLSHTGIIAILEPRLRDIVRDFLLYSSTHRLNRGPAALYVGVSTASCVTLKWLAEQPAGISKDDFVDALVQQFMVHITQV